MTIMGGEMRILTVVGARPQFIKAAVVSRALAARPGVEEVLLHTGQHYDVGMSQVFFEEMDIPRPHCNLDVGSASHGEQTGKMLAGIESVILEFRPDWVMVYGDTNSTLAGALAAAKQHVRVAHVEAGLRSFNRAMPEELNRVLADHASDLLLAPTETAVRNLMREGLAGASVRLVGDVMYDAALYYRDYASDRNPLVNAGVAGIDYVLATVHRAENTNDPVRLEAILEGLAEVSREIPVVLPLHPRTRGIIESTPGLATHAGAIHLIDPVGYLDMVALESGAQLVATDSGGVQKEAFFFGIPCVTLRDETEWVELVELGWNTLVPPLTAEAVRDGVLAALGSRGEVAAPYGDGAAGFRVVEAILGWGQ